VIYFQAWEIDSAGFSSLRRNSSNPWKLCVPCVLWRLKFLDYLTVVFPGNMPFVALVKEEDAEHAEVAGGT